MKGGSVSALILIFCFSTAPVFISGPVLGGGDERLVACNYSDRYHLVSCKIVQKIDPEYRVYFNNEQEASAAGFVPCKKCHLDLVTNNLYFKHPKA